MRSPRARPSSLRPRVAVLAGGLLPVLAAAVAAVVPGATAATPRRERIVPGDTVQGDILFRGDFDEYVFDAPRGARVSMSFRRVAPGTWKPYMGVLGDEYSPSYGGYLYPTKLVVERPLETSGSQRLVVSSAEGSLGAYQLTLKSVPARSFTGPVPGDETPESVTFGAVAGAIVSVTASWSGAGPVTLASVAGPAGPLTSADAPRTGSRSARWTGYTTAALGDHVATFTVPAGVTKWSARITVVSPKPPKGGTYDFRTVGAPAPLPVEVLPGGPGVGFVIAGERGGANDFVVGPMISNPAELAFTATDSRAAGCTFSPAGDAVPPPAYVVRCTSGWSADVAGVVREDSRITAIGSAAMRSPYGTGTTSLSAIVYDAAGRPESWTETRTYDATGRTHVLRISDVRRLADGRILTLSVEHEAPDGRRRRIDYSPLSLGGS